MNYRSYLVFAFVALLLLVLVDAAPGAARAADPVAAPGWPPLIIDPGQLPPVTPDPLPPVRQQGGACFVAGFTGWRGVDDSRGDALTNIDQFESPADAKAFNDSSAILKLLKATQGSYSGDDPHVYRFYDWLTKALPEIQAAAANGQRIVLVGHGPGGSAALTIAQTLQLQGIPVELLIEIDTFDGQARGLTPSAEATLTNLLQRATLSPSWLYANPSRVPRNVLEALNYYQRQSPYYHGRPQLYDDRGGIQTDREITTDSRGTPVQHDTIDTQVAGLTEVHDAIAAACVPAAPPAPPPICSGFALGPMCDPTPGIFPN